MKVNGENLHRVFDFHSFSVYFCKGKMDVGAHIIIRGLVQGVGFRYFVYTRATRLHLLGFVKNSADGSVEVNVEGNRSLIEELLRDLKIGPRSAQVTDVNIRWTDADRHFTEFNIH